MVEEAQMRKILTKLALPTALLLFCGTPGFAQVRLGMDIGSVSIRMAPDGPPPNRAEHRLPRPEGNHVWIDGYWDRQEDRWAWAPGRWEAPGQPGSSWVKPQYRKDRAGTRYEPGHWSHQKMVEGDDYNRWHQDHKR
jgi:hypothetical protein